MICELRLEGHFRSICPLKYRQNTAAQKRIIIYALLKKTSTYLQMLVLWLATPGIESRPGALGLASG